MESAIDELDKVIEKLMAPAVTEAIAVDHELADELMHSLSRARKNLAATRPRQSPQQHQ
jgi:uncharacterized alpha-E superfamily protein